MSTAVAGVDYTPIFNWSPPRSRKVSLLSFIAASVALHAFCFYVFQIIYPPTVALLPPPARINIITPASEEGRVLLRWVEAEDPAISSITQRSPQASNVFSSKSAHIPSYLTRQPALRELPPYQPNLGVPSSHPPGPVAWRQVTTPVAASPASTEVNFTSEVESLGQPQFPPARFVASSRETPQAARFRIAIDQRGVVRHCLLAESSGDSSLDQQARRHLLLCRFPAAPPAQHSNEAELVWAGAIFEWGSDVAPAESRASNTP